MRGSMRHIGDSILWPAGERRERELIMHDKGYYHSRIAADRRRHDRQVSAARPQRQYVET